MSKLYSRRYRVVIGDSVEIDGLDVAFHITKSTKKEPNKAEISIYNLSDDTRGKIEGKRDQLGKLKNPVAVDFHAGYRDGTSLIFAGDVHTIVTVKEGNDLVTKLYGGDGLAQVRQARVSFGVKKGTRFTDVFKKIAQGGGFNLGNLVEVTSDAKIKDMGSTFPEGTVVDGSAYDELERLAESAGFEVSIQDRALQFKKKGEAVDETAIELSADTGLIGSPSVEAQQDPGKKSPQEKFVVAECLLIPGIFPGRKINLTESNLKGTYEAVVVEAQGERSGEKWGYTLKLRPL